MIRMTRAAAAAALLLTAAASTADVQFTSPAHQDRDFKRAAGFQSAFGMDMFQVLVERDNTTNLFFSPMSVGVSLAMIYAGSRGATAATMARALHFQGEKRDVMHSHRRLVRHYRGLARHAVTVRMTSNLYVSASQPLAPKFPRYASNMFDANVAAADFGRAEEAAELINAQVRNDTAGTIDKLITPDMLSDQTLFVLANAVYFKGSWLMRFDAADTSAGTFHAPDGPRTVHMMTATKLFPEARLPELEARAIMLPYQGEELAMVILLPDRADGVYSLQQQLDNATFPDVLARLETLVETELHVPRFQVSAELDLAPVLTELGMGSLFDPARADLSGIVGAPGLALSAAVHKAFVDVNEEGTEAAAASGFACCSRAQPPEMEPFVVDRPFVFAILDTEAETLLFLGRVMELGTAETPPPPAQPAV